MRKTIFWCGAVLVLVACSSPTAPQLTQYNRLANDETPQWICPPHTGMVIHTGMVPPFPEGCDRWYPE